MHARWVLSLVACAGPVWGEEPEVSPLAPYYGFLPVEVFKVSERSGNLLAGDFNHDGRTDLVVVDNGHHRLDLFLQRGSREDAVAARPEAAKDVNFVENDWRFDHQKLPVDHEVIALAAGDFNHDGRTDLAYFGSPDQLLIRMQSEDGTWNKKQTLRLTNVAAAAWCLAAGDINGDGRTDLVILGKNDTYVLPQPETGEFSVPRPLLNTSSQLGLLQIADLNGDGLDDLSYLAGDAADRMLGVRLQNHARQIGPEFIFDLQRPRAVAVREMDDAVGAEVLTIDSRSGRLNVSKLGMRQHGENSLPDRLVRYGFGRRGSGRNRDLALGDFDGNGLTDVVVSDPEAARVLLFLQTRKQGLDLGTPSPSVSGADVLRPLALPGENRQALFVHSDAEKSIGLSEWKDGRLTFPSAVPLPEPPIGMELLQLSGDDRPELLFLTRPQGSKSESYQLSIYTQGPEGKWQPDPAAGSTPLSLPSLKGSPEQMLTAQLTGDERPELLIFQGSRPPIVLGMVDDRLQELTTSGALGAGTIPAGAVFPCRLNDVTGLLVAQENFVRLLELDEQLRWRVVEQFNAGESGARVVGAAVLELDGKPGDELVMVDVGVKKLRVLQRQGQRYQAWKEVELGDFDYKSLRIADLNADERADLLLFGADQFAVLYAGGLTPTLNELASYEMTRERSFPTDVVAGDVNSDEKTDLVLLDTRGHTAEVLAYQGPGKLSRATYFTVFEEKGFAQQEGAGRDPREGIVADVTGDGRADLILLAHDRLLVYPQDPGEAPVSQTAGASK